MTILNASVSQISNFDLKDRFVDLRPHKSATVRSITELEMMRAEGRPVTASKHGLEVICGASCETGAQ